MKKLFHTLAVAANLITLVGMVAFGAFHYTEAQAEQSINSLKAEEIHCLQQNIYFEAGNQSILGKRAVAWVTLNRVVDNRYPDSICGVVWQKRAFSWTEDGKPDVPLDNVLEQQAWQSSGEIATEVLKNWIKNESDPTVGANHFHADYVQPFWADVKYKTVTIDDHIFYNLRW